MTEEEDDWLHINRIPLAMSPPDPSHRATKVAAWLNSPAVMLTELTKTLNNLLSCCRYCADDPELLEVDTDKVDPSGILKCAIGGDFVSDIETLRIRNSIQPTPLNVEFVDDVRKHFDVCSQSTVQLQSLHEFTDAVRYYQYQLEILADWIEVLRVAAADAIGGDGYPNSSTVTAEQLAIHAEVTERCIRKILSDSPSETDNNGRKLFDYASALPVLRDWCNNSRMRNLNSKEWPNLPENLKTLRPERKKK